MAAAIQFTVVLQLKLAVIGDGRRFFPRVNPGAGAQAWVALSERRPNVYGL
jgi:hypothetical protein